MSRSQAVRWSRGDIRMKEIKIRIGYRTGDIRDWRFRIGVDEKMR